MQSGGGSSQEPDEGTHLWLAVQHLWPVAHRPEHVRSVPDGWVANEFLSHFKQVVVVGLVGAVVAGAVVAGTVVAAGVVAGGVVSGAVVVDAVVAAAVVTCVVVAGSVVAGALVVA